MLLISQHVKNVRTMNIVIFDYLGGKNGEYKIHNFNGGVN